MPETDFMDAGALAVRVAELTAALAERDSVIADFKLALSNRDADYAALLERVGELERRLGLDSSNSGKPPSSDGLAKPNAPSRDNARRRSDRRPGGQKGHPGSTLARSGTPDRIEHHRPEVCPGCGGRLDPGDSEVHASRQVHDIPEPVPPQVIEHRVHRCRCRACGEVAVAGFPEGVNAPAQYGLNARALVLYLNSVQFIPRQRQVELLRDLFGLKLSQGTVSAIIGRGAGEFAQLAGQIRKLIAEAPVKHMDETGMSSSSFSRCSIMKHSGALMSSRFMPPNVDAKSFTAAIKASGSSVSSSRSTEFTSANLLKRIAFPSITGLEASAPRLPSPKIAVPFVITATVLPFVV